MIQSDRIQVLNDAPVRDGRFVLYWMQQSQRAEYNHALEYAVRQANEQKKPLVVGFALFERYPEANLRHYAFMLEGLLETEAALQKLGIRMIVRKGHPSKTISEIGKQAASIVCDRGYLRHQSQWRTEVARYAECRVVQVESDVVVPVATASDKAEYAAHTIRRKIHSRIDACLKPVTRIAPHQSSLSMDVESIHLTDADSVLKDLNINRRIGPVTRFFKGGTSEAKKRFRRFLTGHFDQYQHLRNQPQTDVTSRMSPYLHFGQISPVWIALQIQSATNGNTSDKQAYLEELIVRRELAINFVHYSEAYDRYECLPKWARTTLETHRTDRRETVYTKKRLETADTHDPYWNAAMNEMKHTGYMHNYMRMYWGKKILEWSESSETAWQTALELNNRYFVDGRDPNSYAGIGWVFGLHDRPWKERPVFGMVRYMAASGLERKCDIRGYVRKVEGLMAR